MSIETKYVCDVCGAVRGEANHWFILGIYVFYSLSVRIV